MGLDLGTLYIVVVYMDDMPCEDIPIDIYDSEISHKPYIVVPVEYLVNKKKVEDDRIRFKVEKRDKRLKREGIIIIKKGRESQSHEKGHDDAVDNQ